MQIFLILAVLLAIIAVIFAVQNVTVVSISFFVWSIDVSLAVALLIALGAGVLITLLLSIPGKVKDSLNSAAGKKKYTSLETERGKLQLKVNEAVAERDKYLKKLEEAEQEIAGLEEQLASLSAALQESDKSPGPRTSPVEPPAGPGNDSLAP